MAKLFFQGRHLPFLLLAFTDVLTDRNNPQWMFSQMRDNDGLQLDRKEGLVLSHIEAFAFPAFQIQQLFLRHRFPELFRSEHPYIFTDQFFHLITMHLRIGRIGVKDLSFLVRNRNAELHRLHYFFKKTEFLLHGTGGSRTCFTLLPRSLHFFSQTILPEGEEEETQENRSDQ